MKAKTADKTHSSEKCRFCREHLEMKLFPNSNKNYLVCGTPGCFNYQVFLGKYVKRVEK